MRLLQFDSIDSLTCDSRILGEPFFRSFTCTHKPLVICLWSFDYATYFCLFSPGLRPFSGLPGHKQANLRQIIHTKISAKYKLASVFQHVPGKENGLESALIITQSCTVTTYLILLPTSLKSSGVLSKPFPHYVISLRVWHRIHVRYIISEGKYWSNSSTKSILTLQPHSSHVYFQYVVNIAMELHISQKSTFEYNVCVFCTCARVHAYVNECMYLRLDNP